MDQARGSRAILRRPGDNLAFVRLVAVGFSFCVIAACEGRPANVAEGESAAEGEEEGGEGEGGEGEGGEGEGGEGDGGEGEGEGGHCTREDATSILEACYTPDQVTPTHDAFFAEYGKGHAYLGLAHVVGPCTAALTPQQVDASAPADVTFSPMFAIAFDSIEWASDGAPDPTGMLFVEATYSPEEITPGEPLPDVHVCDGWFVNAYRYTGPREGVFDAGITCGGITVNAANTMLHDQHVDMWEDYLPLVSGESVADTEIEFDTTVETRAPADEIVTTQDSLLSSHVGAPIPFGVSLPDSTICDGA